MLIMVPRVALMSAVVPQPLALINAASNQQATSATLAINKPTGTLDGDLMLALLTADTGVSWTGDTGWTEVLDSTTGSPLRVAWKIAAAEGSSFTFTANVSATLSGIIISSRYAAFDAIGAINSATNPVAPQITLSKNGSLLFGFYSSGGASVSFSTPGGMSSVSADSDATAPSWAAFAEARNSGATGSRTSNSSPGTASAGVLIGVKPFYP